MGLKGCTCVGAILPTYRSEFTNHPP